MATYCGYQEGRRRCHVWLAGVLGVGLWLGGTQSGAAGLPALINGQPLPSLADIIEPVIPAVVNITTSIHTQVPENPLLSDPFFRQFFNIPNRQGLGNREQKSLGSGVVVDAKEGLVLTNHHVINKADQITVTLRDGRSIPAKLVGVDPETDIAVVRVEAKNLRDLPWGDSDKLRVGDFLVAIGNPFGLGQTVTSGIVSALGRKGLGIKGYEDFIQTDASINPGNSGGALVNLRGELVGINTAILARGGGNVGIGFAIPVNMARQVMQQLVQYGEVRRGLLGVHVQNLTEALATALGTTATSGTVISQVIPGSSAEQAGLLRGDVIVSANGHPVRDSADLHNVVGLARTLDKVTLEIIRKGQTRKVVVTVAEPRQEGSAADEETFQDKPGGELDERLQGALLRSNEGDVGQGMIVLRVEPNSRAWNIGLRKGDRIVAVNRRPVTSFRSLSGAIQESDGGMQVQIRRGKKVLLIVVR